MCGVICCSGSDDDDSIFADNDSCGRSSLSSEELNGSS
jgi:hypothetical protein